jgi:hypothetical protein
LEIEKTITMNVLKNNNNDIFEESKKSMGASDHKPAFVVQSACAHGLEQLSTVGDRKSCRWSVLHIDFVFDIKLIPLGV